MPVVPALAPETAPDSTQTVYERIKETLGHEKVPLGYQMMGQVEPFLKDSYMNFRKFIADGGGLLDVKQRHALVLATSSAMNCAHCVRSHARDSVREGVLTEVEVAEILAVTATCAMYNNYYKFRDLSGDEKFGTFSVALRAHTFKQTSLGDALVELINVVVSNINGCPTCTAGHVQKSLSLGLTHEHIDEAIKVSATMTAFNVFHRTQ